MMKSYTEIRIRKYNNGDVSYFNENNQLHREDGPAVTWKDGSKFWYQNNELHREDGPAAIHGEMKYWYKNGKLHREDGPAAIDKKGQKTYYLNGIFYFEKDWEAAVNKLKKPKTKPKPKKSSCNGKLVKIEGKTYKLVEVKK